jgi:hypothetical protein
MFFDVTNPMKVSDDAAIRAPISQPFFGAARGGKAGWRGYRDFILGHTLAEPTLASVQGLRARVATEGGTAGSLAELLPTVRGMTSVDFTAREIDWVARSAC